MKYTATYFRKLLKNLTIRQYLKMKARKRLKLEARLSRKEALVSKIVKTSLADRSNILLNAPISGTKYIKTPDDEMFIIMSDTNVIISNHKFYYDIDISHDLADALVARFNRILEHQRHLMEKELLGNIVDGLYSISEKMEENISQQKLQTLNENRGS